MLMYNALSERHFSELLYTVFGFVHHHDLFRCFHYMADAESDFLCKVCMDAPVDCVLLDCGHMLTCVRCGRQLAECPICRQYVVRVVHAFRV